MREGYIYPNMKLTTSRTNFACSAKFINNICAAVGGGKEFAMKKIRIAQIGVNRYSHALSVFNSIKTLPDIFEVVGYCLVEGEKERFQKELSVFKGYPELTLEEILNDPTIEAVTVETEEIHLTKYAIMAAEHNKMIHMEKPGGTSLEEFEKLIALVKEKNLVFHTGYMYRYNPTIREVIENAKAGVYGDIISVEAQMNGINVAEMRQWLEAFPGGMMFYLGCHLIDLIITIMGLPEKVYPFNRSTGMDGVTSCDYGLALLEYPTGMSIAKTCMTEYGGFERRRLVVCGTKASVELCPLEWLIKKKANQFTEKIDYTVFDWHTKGVRSVGEVHDRYDTMMQGFAAICRGEKVNEYTPDYELTLFKYLLMACGE